MQAQGEYMYYPGRKEGQFDIGLVNRWGNVQAGAFASFKYLELQATISSGGGLGQAAFLLDYIFARGRIGLFVTKGFKNYAVLNSVSSAPGAFTADLRSRRQPAGINFLVGVWGNAYIEATSAYLQMRQGSRRRPSGRAT